MDEPRRLREMTLNSLERALLDAGTQKATSPEARARTLAALGLAGSATLLAGGAAASGSFAATSTTAAGKVAVAASVWTKLAVGISLIGAGTAVPISYYALRSTDAAQRGTVASAVASSPATAREGATATAEELPIGVTLEASQPTAAQASLTRELVTLDAARTLLARGDSRGALILLEKYGRMHPNGRLGIEAEVLRIDALGQAGQRDAARRRADAFLRRHPNSLLAPRVRAHAGS
jgi:hypothetical protein